MRTEEALKSCCDRARQERDYTAYLQAESELADLYLKAGRFEEAFLAAEDVLMLMEELNLEETESFGAALVQAAVACRESGRSREALKGGYVIDDCEGTPDAILIASGSEVELAVKAKGLLQEEGWKIRVVSMPCMDLFEQQDVEYQESVLPRAVTARVAVEAASSFGWHKYTGLDGKVIAIDHFGASAPAGTLFQEFGINTQAVIDAARSLVK